MTTANVKQWEPLDWKRLAIKAGATQFRVPIDPQPGPETAFAVQGPEDRDVWSFGSEGVGEHDPCNFYVESTARAPFSVGDTLDIGGGVLLEVTDVRAQRVFHMTEDEARAEGCGGWNTLFTGTDNGPVVDIGGGFTMQSLGTCVSPVGEFMLTFDRDYPDLDVDEAWVWSVSFRPAPR